MQTVQSDVHVRTEAPADVAAIRVVIEDAFREHPHSRQTEAQVVDALRRAGGLSLSLVAHRAGQVVGHAAFAPIGITGDAPGWHSLGPLSVATAAQGAGVGTALVWHGLRTMRQLGAAGCVVLGEPAYYGRVGFRATPALRLEGAPPGCFLVRPFERLIPMGTVRYHPAFDLVEPSDWT
ncbi:MAG: GNAT family N-acetyltransferase, partial [Hydrogenophaga sp.]|uniref:GNAT family N-acetyltransferase n=1 Tax=Hydrogenophaga sp. TaxID=1904254 RepID=UPI003D9B3C2C